MIINPKPYIDFIDIQYPNHTTIDLRDVDFKGVPVKSGKIAISFSFCVFKKLTIKNTDKIDFDGLSIIFSNCYIRDLEISELVTENLSINIHASMLNGRISAKKLFSININNCILMTGVTLQNQRSIELSYTTENIYPSEWKKMITKFGLKNYKQLIKFQQFYQIESPGKLVVKSSRKTSDVPGRHLDHWSDIKKYRIRYRPTKAEENSFRIHLSVNYLDNIDLQTTVNNMIFESISLSGTSVGKISFEDIQVSNWYMSEFCPQKETTFYNITPRTLFVDETKLGVHKCSFDNISFDNVEFDKFERLSFFRSKLAKANFISCSFPDKYERYAKFLPVPNIHYPEQKPLNYHKDQYEMLLQLKKAFDSTGNFYEGLKLQAISYAALQKIAVITGEDRFILWLNRLSNNHGLSIKRPIYWFFGLTIFLYLLYLLSLHRLFQRTSFDANLFGYYFSFIDITHRSDFLEKNSLTGWALAVDYLTKIITGYLIYQFVAAFRKYGKSG